jgi:hypothetical protein
MHLLGLANDPRASQRALIDWVLFAMVSNGRQRGANAYGLSDVLNAPVPDEPPLARSDIENCAGRVNPN